MSCGVAEDSARGMMYVAKPMSVDAFQYGVNPQPDWFRGITNLGYVKYEGKDGNEWGVLETPKKKYVLARGDYVVRTGEFKIIVLTPELFDVLFVRPGTGTQTITFQM